MDSSLFKKNDDLDFETNLQNFDVEQMKKERSDKQYPKRNERGQENKKNLRKLTS